MTTTMASGSFRAATQPRTFLVMACDGELLSRAREGDLSAFEVLVERHRDDLYSFGLWMTRSETDAATFAQESFLSAFRHLDELRNEAEFAAWVRWIAAIHASIKLRLDRRAPAVEEQLEPLKLRPAEVPARYPRADWSDGTDERALSAELRGAIEDATEHLPQSHREVFLLRDLAGLSYEQIACITGDSVPAIKRDLHQARLRLRGTIHPF